MFFTPNGIGYYIHSGCDIPENAKLENVQALVASVMDG